MGGASRDKEAGICEKIERACGSPHIPQQHSYSPGFRVRKNSAVRELQRLRCEALTGLRRLIGLTTSALLRMCATRQHLLRENSEFDA